jgi:hypothetical protein
MRFAQFLLQAGHDRQRDDHRHDPNGDAERRNERDDGNERLLAAWRADSAARRAVQREDPSITHH